MPNASSTTLNGALLALGLSLGALPYTVQAALVDITVTGSVDQVTGPVLGTQFNTTQTMSATITYDTSTPGTSGPVPFYQKNYSPAITGGGFSIGGYAGTIPTGIIRVRNDEPTDGDAVQWVGQALAAAVGPEIPERFGLAFDDPSGAAISSFALPLSVADLAGFTDRRWGLSFGSVLGPGTPPGVAGPLTSVTITVRPAVSIPLAPTVFLMAIGLVGFGQLRRRRRLSNHSM